MIWNLRAAPATARSSAAAALELYEMVARTISEWEWTLARDCVPEPLGRMIAGCADLTRDLAAVQLSAARWVLDL